MIPTALCSSCAPPMARKHGSMLAAQLGGSWLYVIHNHRLLASCTTLPVAYPLGRLSLERWSQPDRQPDRRRQRKASSCVPLKWGSTACLLAACVCLCKSLSLSVFLETAEQVDTRPEQLLTRQELFDCLRPPCLDALHFSGQHPFLVCFDGSSPGVAGVADGLEQAHRSARPARLSHFITSAHVHVQNRERAIQQEEVRGIVFICLSDFSRALPLVAHCASRSEVSVTWPQTRLICRLRGQAVKAAPGDRARCCLIAIA